MAVLTDEQQMLKDMAAAWVADRAPVGAYRTLLDDAAAGSDPALFAEMAEMGWTGILVPEEHGGSAFGAASLGLVLEEAARSLVAAPLLSSALAATSALVMGGSAAQQARWLPKLVAGDAVGALAIDEGGRHDPAAIALAAREQGGKWRLSGTKRPVQDGLTATFYVVAARSGEVGAGLFLVSADAAGVTRRGLDQLDGRRPAIVTFDDAAAEPLGEPGDGTALIEAVLDRARIGLAAELLGMAEQGYAVTLDYLKTRKQFGRLIGGFQALQHRAAAMYGELMLTRSAVEAALAAIDAGDQALPTFASLAKAIAGETAKLVAREMVQMHGGIGMTHEHDAGLYMKRIWAADATYGNAAFHRERWGRLSGF